MRKIRKRSFTGTRSNAVTEREIYGMNCARRAADGGIVLLKNENHILPLKAGSRIALYGSGASQTVKGGTGSGDVNERESVSIYQGVKDAGYIITDEDWIEDYNQRYQNARISWRDDILRRSQKHQETLEFFEIYSHTPFVRPAGKQIEKTEADTAVYVISRVAGEGADRNDEKGDYLLSDAEEQELARVCDLYDHVVVVLNTGGVIDLSFMDKSPNIEGLVDLCQAGMEGGHALADILSGEVNPSGKLTATWAYHYEDYPNSQEFSHMNGDLQHEYYNEGIFVGYRYFDSFHIPVRYGFGFGLSYSDFSIITEQVEEEPGTGIRISVKVKNDGDALGREVVQVYAACPDGRLEKERRRLVAFSKTRLLMPGESENCLLQVPYSALASYDMETPGWLLEKGRYCLYIGNSLADSVPSVAADLAKDVLLEKTRHVCVPENPIEEYHLSREIRNTWVQEKQDDEKKIGEDFILSLHADAITTRTVTYHTNAELSDPEGLAFVQKLTPEQRRHLATGDPGKAQGAQLGSSGFSVPGSAAQTSACAEKEGLASIVLADGPAGLRLNRCYYVRGGEIVQMPFQFSMEGGIFMPDADRMEGDKYYQYCTAFPVGTVLAQSWDEDLVAEVGRCVAGEMQLFHVTLWLAPGMCIQRNPLCGRNFEYYSEDPLISGKIAAAMTKGVQSVPGCGTTIKHFACNNNEDNRMGCDSILSERALREIYLRGFSIAIREAAPMAIMTSYNKINGIHSANNYDLCNNVARNEFGFRGLIMTDWTTTHNGPDCTAAGCMRAGNDIVMPGCQNDQRNLEEELADGRLSEADLDACVSRLVRTVWQSGEYEE